MMDFSWPQFPSQAVAKSSEFSNSTPGTTGPAECFGHVAPYRTEYPNCHFEGNIPDFQTQAFILLGPDPMIFPYVIYIYTYITLHYITFTLHYITLTLHYINYMHMHMHIHIYMLLYMYMCTYDYPILSPMSIYVIYRWLPNGKPTGWPLRSGSWRTSL